MTGRIGMRAALFIAIVATIGCDRATKHFATVALSGEPGRSYFADTVRLEYAENEGAFLSLGATLPAPARTGLFTIGTGLILLVLAGAALRLRWRGWLLVGAALVIAGGASNWIDRVIAGKVVDFIVVGIGPLRTGVFNVADVAIMVGVTALAIGEVRARLARGDRAG